MMTNINKLKPCPFCKSEEIVRSVDVAIWPDYMSPDDIIRFDTDDKVPITTTIYCDNCGCQIQQWDFDRDVSINLAYDHWNKRANEKTIFDWIYFAFVLEHNDMFFEFIKKLSNEK